ncbi:hypothetical protein [Croceicoccus marinus]|uniref:Uncharacterized protein n=1 Tax=Croceicoccus marinus TaxID=450378 RepID=A0A7G6VRU6_9SPHN|nr:hypothetical protein [Croceicoccus marinus]QNE04461.1 hypothetical protein H4O24_10810 [Croceicoccus marinus]
MTDAERELIATNRHAHQHFDALLISGSDERTVVVSFAIAAIERAVLAGGKDATANWLRSLAHRVEQGQMNKPDTD